jgi:hypothetical protein
VQWNQLGGAGLIVQTRLPVPDASLIR